MKEKIVVRVIANLILSIVVVVVLLVLLYWLDNYHKNIMAGLVVAGLVALAFYILWDWYN